MQFKTHGSILNLWFKTSTAFAIIILEYLGKGGFPHE